MEITINVKYAQSDESIDWTQCNESSLAWVGCAKALVRIVKSLCYATLDQTFDDQCGPWQILQLLTMVVRKPFAHEEVQQFLAQLCLQLPPSADPPQTAMKQASFSFWSDETSPAGAVQTDTHASSEEGWKALDSGWNCHKMSSFCVA